MQVKIQKVADLPKNSDYERCNPPGNEKCVWEWHYKGGQTLMQKLGTISVKAFWKYNHSAKMSLAERLKGKRVKLSLCLTKHHTFLTSALDRGEWSASHPGCFISRERAPVPTG
jgi:hypothetical protein